MAKAAGVAKDHGRNERSKAVGVFKVSTEKRTIEPRTVAVFSLIGTAVVVAVIIGNLLVNNTFDALAEGERKETLVVVDKVMDDGTTLCVVEWEGKLRNVYGYPCPIPVGQEVPVTITLQTMPDAPKYALEFDLETYLAEE